MKALNLISCMIIALLAMPYTSDAYPQSVDGLYQANQHVLRGDQYMAINLWDEAEQEYWKAIDLDYNNIKARQGLGDVFSKKKIFEKAIENYQIVLNQQPNNVEIQYLISLSYYDNLQYELAKINAQKALQMDPELAKAENLVRLSETKQKEQDLELRLLRQKEQEALQRYSQLQEQKEKAFLGKIVPGWRLIQTGTPKNKWTGYLVLGSTAGLLVGGHFLRSAGQKAYNNAMESADAGNKEYFDYYVDLGTRRYDAGGYMIDAALGVFMLNMVDSFILKGKIFGGKSTRVKPSLPEPDRDRPY
ncbi:MAG TPA: hypothetical protein VM123_04460 [archaeon]|nr:hypothetical protein [archaeon]